MHEAEEVPVETCQTVRLKMAYIQTKILAVGFCLSLRLNQESYQSLSVNAKRILMEKSLNYDRNYLKNVSHSPTEVDAGC